MNLTSRRAEYVSIGGLILSLVTFVATWVIGVTCNSDAVVMSMWQILAGFLMWVVLAVYFHQCSRAEQEKLDMAQLAATHQGETIFNSGSDREALLNVAQNRLKGLEKWFMPGYGLFLALYQVGIGIYLFTRIQTDNVDPDTFHKLLPGALFLIMLAFVNFLISRYATGMSTQKQWSPLRAAGAYSLVSSIILALLTVSLVLVQYNYTVGVIVMAYVTPVLLVVLGAEICLNTVLDIYRPRIKGQAVRFALDSRLLGVINEPGGILHTFSSAIDYQFGFKVSQTWFYHLFIQAVVPLFLLFVITLYSLSCVVVIGPGQQAIIERLGKFDENSVVGSGLIYKLPSPFAKAHVYDTEKVKLINIGFEEDEDFKDSMKPLLWGEKHYKKEYNLLVATSDHNPDSDQGGAPVSLVNAAVPIKYKIKDLYQYVTGHIDPDQRLEAICNSEFAKYAASSQIEADSDGGLENSLIGAGRSKAAEYLRSIIQVKADQAQLGLEIVFVGMQAVHPPSEVSEAYQGVIGAVQQRQRDILYAEADSNYMLTELCGSVDKANELYGILQRLRVAEESENREQIDTISSELRTAMENSQGTVFKTLAEAESYRFERATLAKAAGERFAGQVKAYRANPNIYKKAQRLDMMKDALQGVRKYVIVADDQDSEVFIVNLEEKYQSGLMDFDPEAIE